MFVIEVRIQGSERFSEILPEDLLEVECAVEDIVSCSLLQIFDTILVQEVSIRYIPVEQRAATNSTTNT